MAGLGSVTRSIDCPQTCFRDCCTSMSNTARKRYSISELLNLNSPLLPHHDLKPGETPSKRSARLVEGVLRNVLVVI